MEKQGRSGILFQCFKEHTKIGLDICAGTCYNIVRKCGHRTSASISAFQAEEVGSIPIARSMQKKALSSPELGAFLHIWGKMFGVHLLFTKKLLTLCIQRIILKAKERDLYVSDNGKHPYGQ